MSANWPCALVSVTSGNTRHSRLQPPISTTASGSSVTNRIARLSDPRTKRCGTSQSNLSGAAYPKRSSWLALTTIPCWALRVRTTTAQAFLRVLESASLFKGRQTKRSLRFVTFVNEEPPFSYTQEMGSLVYACRAREQGEQITAMLSLETIGYYSDVPGSQRYPFPFSLFYPDKANFSCFCGQSLLPPPGTPCPAYLSTLHALSVRRFGVSRLDHRCRLVRSLVVLAGWLSCHHGHGHSPVSLRPLPRPNGHT